MRKRQRERMKVGQGQPRMFFPIIRQAWAPNKKQNSINVLTWNLRVPRFFLVTYFFRFINVLVEAGNVVTENLTCGAIGSRKFHAWSDRFEENSTHGAIGYRKLMHRTVGYRKLTHGAISCRKFDAWSDRLQKIDT